MYDKLVHLPKQFIARWKAKSSQSNSSITDIAFGIGLITAAIPFSPITFPEWILPVSAFIIALYAKLTVEE
jgi:hypothetical protein